MCYSFGINQNTSHFCLFLNHQIFSAHRLLQINKCLYFLKNILIFYFHLNNIYFTKINMNHKINNLNIQVAIQPFLTNVTFNFEFQNLTL